MGGKRFLRKRYKDPMTGKDEWRLINVDGAGVLTNSKVNPLSKDTKKPGENTVVTEFAGLGTQGGLGTAGVNMGLRRRPSEGTGDAQFEPMPSSGAGSPQLGQSANPGAATPQIPSPIVAQGQPQFNPDGTPNTQANANPNGQPNPAVTGQNGVPPTIQGQLFPGSLPPPGGAPGQNGQAPAAAVGGSTGMPAGINQPMQGQQGFPFPGAGQQQPGIGQQPFPGPQPFPNQQQPFPNQQQQGNMSQPGFPQNAQMGPQPMPQTGQAGFNQGAGFPQGQGFQNQPSGPNAAAAVIMNQLTQPRPQGQPFPGAPPGFQIGGGIAGVASTAEIEAIKIYNEREKYDEWEFVYDPKKDKRLAMQQRGLQGGGAQGNQPGRPLGGGPGGGGPGGVGPGGVGPGANGPAGSGGFGGSGSGAGGIGGNSGFPQPSFPGGQRR